MVYYKEVAKKDLNNLFIGLMTWKRFQLNLEHVLSYLKDLELECENLDNKFIHQLSMYRTHKQYGRYIHRYRRNTQTIWYIVYNLDEFKNVWIEKIINNHLSF